MNQLPPELASLSDDEKFELSQLLLQSIPDDLSCLTAEQVLDLERRLNDDRLHPEKRIAWETAWATLIERRCNIVY